MTVSRRSTSVKRSSVLTPRHTAKQARAQLDDDVERARRMLRVDEEERRRLSLALHKGVTQSLAALATNLDLIEQQATLLAGSTRGLLLTSRLIVRDCFKQIRLLTDQLAPPLVAELGLRLAVQCMAASFSERLGITIVCDATDCPRLSDDVELALLRVVEDCLENLDPLVSVPSIALLPTKAGVELHVRPVRPALVVRWKQRVLLQFGTGIDVRMVSSSSNDRESSRPARFGLIATARSDATARR
jgi:signal transduction histidine kinase